MPAVTFTRGRLDKMADKLKKSLVSKVKEIKKNTKLILESSSNANLLVDILDISDTDEEEIAMAFIKSVHKIFTFFLKDNKVIKKKVDQNVESCEKKEDIDEKGNPEEEFGVWLYEKYLAIIHRLLKLLKNKVTEIQELSLCTLMKFLVAEHQGLVTKSKSLFPVVLYDRILGELLSEDTDQSFVIERFSEFLEYDDIRYFSLKNLNKAIQNRPTESTKCNFFVQNTYSLLMLVKLPFNEEEINNFLVVKDQTQAKIAGTLKSDVFLLKAHKKLFSKAWIAFLSQPLTSVMHKKVLMNLHTQVIPHMNDPKLLMDFLTDSYNSGGAISLLALNGLFILIHQHNLDYPDFYKKLYALLEPGIFHAKYQSRFFHLLDLFLTSTHLPAYLVAAFCKRVSQVALSAPPAGVILAVMFLKNLLKRHPSCKVLIQKKEISKLLLNCENQQFEDLSNGSSIDPSNDPYDPKEPDPAKCNALQSSLWELKTHENHFYPKIPSLVEAFQKPLDKIEVDISKYFEVGYDDLFKKHCVKVTESNAILDYQVPKGFLGNELSGLWTIGN